MKKNYMILEWVKQYTGKISPILFFVITSLIFGTITLLLTPPFQSPDEVNHFFRAYQISEGRFISEKQDQRLGGNLPLSLKKISDPFTHVRYNIHRKISFAEIKEVLQIPLDPDKREFVDFPNTALYPSVVYFPHAFMIFILREFSVPPLYIFYCTRFFMLFFWIAGIAFAIKIIPFFKWTFALLALLPMSIFTNMSISADVPTNVLSFISIALILKFVFDEDPFTRKRFITLILLTILLTSTKLVYVPLILMFFLIPSSKFNNNKVRFFHFGTLVIIGVFSLWCWSKQVNELYIPYSNYNSQYRDDIDLAKGADMNEQVKYIREHGTYILHVFVKSASVAFPMYSEGYIGTFGWLDTKLPIWFIELSYLIILIIALIEGEKNIKLNVQQKIIVFFSLLASLFLLVLSQHLSWDVVGGEAAAILQGRYFIPVFPLLLILFYNVKIPKPKLAMAFVIFFSIFSLSLTSKTLYTRYYVPTEFEIKEINCDAEKIAKDDLFTTTVDSICLSGATSQTSEKAHSGKYSVKLTGKKPFAFNYKIRNARFADMILLEVWRYGKAGGIVVDDDSGDNFYVTKFTSENKDSTGWEKISLNFYFQCDMTGRETGIYLYNDTQDSSYFDDMKITYKKMK